MSLLKSSGSSSIEENEKIMQVVKSMLKKDFLDDKIIVDKIKELGVDFNFLKYFNEKEYIFPLDSSKMFGTCISKDVIEEQQLIYTRKFRHTIEKLRDHFEIEYFDNSVILNVQNFIKRNLRRINRRLKMIYHDPTFKFLMTTFISYSATNLIYNKEFFRRKISFLGDTGIITKEYEIFPRYRNFLNCFTFGIMMPSNLIKIIYYLDKNHNWDEVPLFERKMTQINLGILFGIFNTYASE